MEVKIMNKIFICTLLAVLANGNASDSRNNNGINKHILDSNDNSQPSKRDSLAVASNNGFTPMQSPHVHQQNYVQAPHLLASAGAQQFYTKDSYPSAGVQIIPSQGIKLATITQPQISYAPQDVQKFNFAAAPAAYPQYQLPYSPQQQQQMYAFAPAAYNFAPAQHRFAAPYGQPQTLTLQAYPSSSSAASPALATQQPQHVQASPTQSYGLGAYGNSIFGANYAGLLAKYYNSAGSSAPAAPVAVSHLNGGHVLQQQQQQPAYAYSIQPSVHVEPAANKQIVSHIASAVPSSQNKHTGLVAAPSNNYQGHGGPGAQSYASFALQTGSQHPEKVAAGSVAPQYYYQNQQVSSIVAPTPSVYAAKPAYQFTQPIVAASPQTYYSGSSYPTASYSQPQAQYSQPQHQYSHGPFSNYALQTHQSAASTIVPKFAYSPAIYQSQISQYQPHSHHHQQPQKFSFYQ